MRGPSRPSRGNRQGRPGAMTGARSQLLGDVRALGAAAPIRAAYEASKRSGLHAVFFRVPRRPPNRADSFLLGNRQPLAADAAERTLDDAKRVLSDGVRVFGRRVPTGVSARWSQDPESGCSWPEGVPWWRVDIRSDARPGDVKFVWEAGRHRDLVVLARAASLDRGGPWLGGLERMLSGWCAENPPERGVHWYSSLELALRAIAWAQVLGLAGARLSEQVQRAMAEQLFASARHLMLELPYTVSSMRNNHLLGDSLGLIVLSRLFASQRAARRWRVIGERLFAKQLARHMRSDGSMVEDSLSYHRFVLEMLIVRVLLGDASQQVRRALASASMHLVRIGVLDGDLPQYGDWDEGRVLASSGDPGDVTGSVALGLSLSGEPIPGEWFARFDELAWYGAPDAPRGPAPLRRAAAASGGIAYVDHRSWRLWFKVGCGPSHGHADLTSVWLQRDGDWVIADPGTGTYNGPIEVRDGLRTSHAHPVVRVGDQDQLVPHRVFRWLHSATGHLAPVARIDDTLVLFGWHDAYQRIAVGLKVARAVVVSEKSVLVLDYVSPEGADRKWTMTVPLAAGVTSRGRALLVGETALPTAGLATASLVTGRNDPFVGWSSPTYGRWQPTEWLTLSGSEQSHAWSIASPVIAARTDGTDGADLHLSIDWSGSSPCLEIHRTGCDGVTVMRA
jgi:hypothetical protein